jgi:Rad52/22 family double-strand break repair protein
MLDNTQIEKLQEPLPKWALKPNPMKPKMTVIHPMAIIDRLNEVFGVGGWNFKTTFIDCTKEKQKTKAGERDVYISSVHATLIVEAHGIHIEQFGGSTNDDKGDALKGGATDALTKMASYLGIGASIYKGQGNIGGLEGTKDMPENVDLPEEDSFQI